MFLRDWEGFDPNLAVEPEPARSRYFADLPPESFRPGGRITVLFHGGQVHITDDPVSIIQNRHGQQPEGCGNTLAAQGRQPSEIGRSARSPLGPVDTAHREGRG